MQIIYISSCWEKCRRGKSEFRPCLIALLIIVIVIYQKLFNFRQISIKMKPIEKRLSGLFLRNHISMNKYSNFYITSKCYFISLHSIRFEWSASAIKSNKTRVWFYCYWNLVNFWANFFDSFLGRNLRLPWILSNDRTLDSTWGFASKVSAFGAVDSDKTASKPQAHVFQLFSKDTCPIVLVHSSFPEISELQQLAEFLPKDYVKRSNSLLITTLISI